MSQNPHYVAKGFPAGTTRAFVSVSPNFPLGPSEGGEPVHVGVALYMTPADARDLSARLLAAADEAEGLPVAAQAVTT